MLYYIFNTQEDNKMTIGQTADKIMLMRQDKSREYWFELYMSYFSEKSDWKEFWDIVEST